jgi:hypothetical protein
MLTNDAKMNFFKRPCHFSLNVRLVQKSDDYSSQFLLFTPFFNKIKSVAVAQSDFETAGSMQNEKGFHGSITVRCEPL